LSGPLVLDGPALVLPADPDVAGALVLAGRLLRAQYRTDALTIPPAVLAVLDAFDELWRAAGARSPGASASAASDSASVACLPSGNRESLSEMTTTTAAHRLGVTPRRVGQLLSAGGLVGRRRGGRWFVSEASVATLEARRSA
jgi:hypothetical protein